MSRQLLYKQVLTAQSALNDASIISQTYGKNSDYIKTYVRFGAGTSAGAVVIEEASDPAYTGTWSLIATLAWSAVTKESSHIMFGNFRALRVRISVAVVGGTVDAWVQISGS
jgi:hypothetical protein